MFNVRPSNIDLFPVPFSIMSLGEESRELNKELIEDTYSEEKLNIDISNQSGQHLWQSLEYLENKYLSYKKLSNIVFELAKPILKKAGFGGNIEEYLACQTLWANINRCPYAYHTPHIHGNGTCIFTGVYFPTSGFLNGQSISEDEDLNLPVDICSKKYPDPGSLVFIDPASTIKSQVTTDNLKRYPYYGANINVTPREGTLVIFPHYLTHLVVPTRKENFTRISIGFNINKI